MPINNNILNQKGTPAFYSDIFANRPAFGYAGRVFISTDTGAIYEDTGSAWTLIADAGAGTTGTLQQVTTNGNTTTLGIVVQGLNISKGTGTGGANTGVGIDTLQSNTTGSLNTALGNQALFANTTGAFNTAIGNGALVSNTTANSNTAVGNVSLNANTTGSGNTAIGYQSQLTNTTGVNNNSLGFNSLRLNTTGGNNVALGTNALQNNTTASDNTAIGNNSLNANTTGTQNTAIGSSALIANTTGSSNTAIGYYSLNKNTTSGQNTAIGYLTLGENTSGTQNTSIGYGALALNTTGFSNTAIGSNSLAVNTTGNNNTAIGIDSLNVNTGSNNTAIGRASLTANTTGTLNTAIGYNSGNAITTGSNNTILGNYVGTPTLASNIVLSDGAGNVRLFSDANGLIGINQAVGSTIGGQLDIHSTQTYALVLNGLSTSNAYTAFSSASVGKWRIGNTYNAGANTFDIFNLGTSSTALSFNSTTNAATFNSSVTAGAFLTNAASGAGGQEGIRINNDNGYIGFFNSANTTRSGYLQGNTTDVTLITSLSTPLIFGTANVEKMRITSGGNVLIGSTTDNTINKLQVTGSVKADGYNAVNGLIATYSLGTIAQFTTITQSIPTSGLYILTNGGNLSGLILITRAGGSQGVQLIFTTGINNVAAGTTTNPGTGGYLNVWVGSSGVLSIENVNGYTGPYYLTSIATF